MDHLRKYSVLECERRFLLPEVPRGLTEPVRILDRYLHETRLRLRRVETMEGEVLQLKLGHKTRPVPESPRLVLHTSMYLDEDEFGVLYRIPGDDLEKVRYVLPTGEAIDHHVRPRRGLAVLEVDLHTEEEADAYSPRLRFTREVTDDEAFSGRELARPK